MLVGLVTPMDPRWRGRPPTLRPRSRAGPGRSGACVEKVSRHYRPGFDQAVRPELPKDCLQMSRRAPGRRRIVESANGRPGRGDAAVTVFETRQVVVNGVRSPVLIGGTGRAGEA